MPEPNGRDIFNEPTEVKSIGLIRFHVSRYVSITLARPKELWYKAAGFWDERAKSILNFDVDRRSEFSVITLIEPTHISLTSPREPPVLSRRLCDFCAYSAFFFQKWREWTTTAFTLSAVRRVINFFDLLGRCSAACSCLSPIRNLEKRARL